MMETTEERIRRESEFSRFVTPYGFTLKEWDELLHPRGEGGRFVFVGDAPVEARLGYELAKHGGYSYDVTTGKSPKDGLIVSKAGSEVVIKDRRATVADIRKQLESTKEGLAGGWYNPEDGVTYLDQSVRVETTEEAERLAVENKQEAYYNAATGETVYTRARAKAEGSQGILHRRHDGRRDTGSARQDVRGLTIGQKVAQAIRLKYNENHDELGRFASGDGWAVGELPRESPSGYIDSPEGILSAWMDSHQSIARNFTFERNADAELTPTGARAVESALVRTSGYLTDNDHIAITVTDVGGTAMATGGPGQVNLGQRFYSTSGELADTVEAIEKHGGETHFYSTGAPDQTVTHEIGHALQDHDKLPTMNGVRMKDWESIVDRNLREAIERGEYVPTTMQREVDKLAIIASRVSVYATKNANEFVAETFNGMVHGKKYDDEVMGLYRSLGGREKQR